MACRRYLVRSRILSKRDAMRPIAGRNIQRDRGDCIQFRTALLTYSSPRTAFSDTVLMDEIIQVGVNGQWGHGSFIIGAEFDYYRNLETLR